MAQPSPIPPPLPRSSRGTKPPRQPEAFASFLKQHRKVRQAFEAFGEAQANYYQSSLEQRRCVFCGARHADRIARFEWVTTMSRAQYEEKPAAHRALNSVLTLISAIHGYWDALRVDVGFVTEHRACERCFADWRRRGLRLALASDVALRVGVVGIFLAMITLPVILTSRGGGGGVPWIKAAFTVGGTIALAIGVICIIMWQLTQRWCVPAALRHICRGGRIRLGAARLLEAKR